MFAHIAAPCSMRRKVAGTVGCDVALAAGCFCLKTLAGCQAAAEAERSSDANGIPSEFSEMAGDGLPRPPARRMAHTSVVRVVLSSGFVICLLLTLIKFLDFSPGPMAIFRVHDHRLFSIAHAHAPETAAAAAGRGDPDTGSGDRPTRGEAKLEYVKLL